MKALEFKDIFSLNEHLKDLDYKLIHSIIPIPRMFDNPKTNSLTSTITYVVIEFEKVF